MGYELGSTITYDQIISVAKTKADELIIDLPTLPTDQELEPFLGKMWTQDRQLIDSVKRHLDEWGVRSPERDFEGHLEWVAKNSAYIAALECSERGIMDISVRDEIIQRAWRLGLLHDIQAWRGWQPIHQLEGMKAARQILDELGIEDSYLEDQILLHDELVVHRRNDPKFDIPFFSVFAVDHLNWGREWEETRWRRMANKKESPVAAVDDTQLIEKMELLKNGPNLQQTKWGREVAVPYIGFGLNIARHVKQTFTRGR